MLDGPQAGQVVADGVLQGERGRGGGGGGGGRSGGGKGPAARRGGVKRVGWQVVRVAHEIVCPAPGDGQSANTGRTTDVPQLPRRPSSSPPPIPPSPRPSPSPGESNTFGGRPGLFCGGSGAGAAARARSPRNCCSCAASWRRWACRDSTVGR